MKVSKPTSKASKKSKNGESLLHLSDSEESDVEDIHEPPDSLELASDDSDYEFDQAPEDKSKITLAMVRVWEKALSANKKSTKPISAAVKGFRAALQRLNDSEASNTNLKVDGSAVFNAIVRLCVSSLYPYLARLLNLPSQSVSKKHVQNSKNWQKVKAHVRAYLVDLIKLIENVTSADIVSILLKHLHQMLPILACLPTIVTPALKRLVMLWSRNEDDTVRVVAFLCILRLTLCDLNAYLHTILKMMYQSYIANSKFVSPSTISGINFMRRSLAEMFSINENISYNHAFLYIRQLAIHLRSAVTLKKKDSIQSVYNWQYIASLNLWTDILCANHHKSRLNSLIYPLVQIIIGCVKLIPTAQYLPLRFHCLEMLIKLCEETGVYIPVLPFLLEVFSLVDMNDKNKAMSWKAMDFTCVLRLSKSQLKENGFKDAAMDHFYHYALQYVACESYRISFPDLVVCMVLRLREVIKECKNGNYSRKLKSLLEKVEETAKMMDGERMKCGLALSDERGVRAWENAAKLKGNPLTVYYVSWKKIREKEMARKTTDNIKLAEYNLPVLIKKTKENDERKSEKKKVKKESGNYELFSSDDEDGEGTKLDASKLSTDEEQIKKRKKNKKDKQAREVVAKKAKKSDTADVEDIVEDFDMEGFWA